MHGRDGAAPWRSISPCRSCATGSPLQRPQCQGCEWELVCWVGNRRGTRARVHRRRRSDVLRGLANVDGPMPRQEGPDLRAAPCWLGGLGVWRSGVSAMQCGELALTISHLPKSKRSLQHCALTGTALGYVKTSMCGRCSAQQHGALHLALLSACTCDMRLRFRPFECVDLLAGNVFCDAVVGGMGQVGPGSRLGCTRP